MTLAAGLAGVAAVLLLAAGAVSWQPEEPARVAAGTWTIDGSVLFRAKGCAVCHTGPDTESGSGLPDLSDAGAWAGARRPGLTAEEYLRESIRDPGRFAAPGIRASNGPVSGMPTLAVSDEEVDALVAYLLER